MSSIRTVARAAALAAAASLAACASAAPPAPVAAGDAPGDPWRAQGEALLAAKLGQSPNHGRAKNVIVFIADGASPTFFTALRILDGQRKGEIGDTYAAPVDAFPYTGLAHTHSADDRVTDSAAAATALFTGVKTHNGALAVTADARTCAEALAGARSSLIDAARASGRKVGVMTTTTITDATPAALYAHAPDRGWQDPRKLTAEDRAAGCADLPEQLVAADLDVAIGGGRALFTPASAGGVRPDGRDLGAEWSARGEGRVYAADAAQLAAVDPAATRKLLALVAPGDLWDPAKFDGPVTTPTLAEMTGKALDVLQSGGEGFFLMIEQEGTDELQHAGLLGRALDSGVEMYDAVRLVLDRVDLADTLVIVTADHGQALAMGGGGPLDTPILGVARYQGKVEVAKDGAPFPQLGFYVGPRARPDKPDRSLDDAKAEARSFIPDAAVPLADVPHSGVDVPVYAAGPWADLFTGSYEQSAVYAFIRHAMTAGR